MQLPSYLPQAINRGPFLTAYSLPTLEQLIGGERLVLPICSLGTPVESLAALSRFVLPPLYHEALADEDLKSQLLSRVRSCFPYYEGTAKRNAYSGVFDIVELAPVRLESPSASPEVVAFSVDTAVEEHGPHLPLATDTIQSYGVLQTLAAENPSLHIGPPVEYGHLTWGLPFGLSIDLTPPLLTRYVTAYTNAILDWWKPQAVYVVDVHGSIVHRNAIESGLEESRCSRWRFRWLHEPLVEFAGERGDQHAGGVETAIVERINPLLLDADWFPTRSEEIAAGQMGMDEAIDLSGDLAAFCERVERDTRFNGIIGDILNYEHVDGELMFQRMLDVARSDLAEL